MRNVALTLLICLLLSASSAHAVVNPAAFWRLGELDLTAIPNDPCREFTIDAIGGFDLARQGTLALNNAFYAADVAPAAANNTGSTLGFRFDNARPGDPCRYFLPQDPCLGATDNFGVEMWVRSGALTQPDDGTGLIFYGENSLGGNPYRMYQVNQSYGLSIFDGTNSHNVGFIPVVVDQWVHLAMVVDGGVTKFFVDGALQGSVNATPQAASGGFGIAAYNDTSVFGARYGFYGSMDESRAFTFEPGQFSPDDLLVNVPEPTTLALAVLGLLGIARRRREPPGSGSICVVFGANCA